MFRPILLSVLVLLLGGPCLARSLSLSLDSVATAAAAGQRPPVEAALSGIGELDKSDQVIFLAAGAALTGTVSYARLDVNGMEARAGELAGLAGQFRLVAGPNVLFGVVEDYSGDRRYEVTGRRGEGAYEVREENLTEHLAAIPPGGESRVPPVEKLLSSGRPEKSAMSQEEEEWARNWNDSEEVELTMMVIFTSQSIAYSGSLENSNARVAAGIALANQCMQNSRIPAVLTCVGTYLCDYAETGDSSLDLDRVTDGRDGFEFVPAMRDRLGADFVCYAPRYMTSGWSGLGWVNPSDQGMEHYAVHVVMHSYLDELSWPHEWGHNMGCDHSYQQSSSPGPSNGGLFGHALGCYFYAPNTGQRCVSIMAYKGYWGGDYYGNQVPYFTGPDLYYGGSAVYYDSRTQSALVWRKIRKFASLFRKIPERQSFRCGFEPSEYFRNGDATWQQGLKSLGASGSICQEGGGNHYLFSKGGNGFELPVNVRTSNQQATYKVSVRVRPTTGTIFDIRGRDEALCYLRVDDNGKLHLYCSGTKGGGVNKSVQLTGLPAGWQTWTLWIDSGSGQITGFALNDSIQEISGCYAARSDVYVAAVWFKDTMGGGDFDDLEVGTDMGSLEAWPRAAAFGSGNAEIVLTNLHPCTRCQFQARILEGAENFTLEPESGVFHNGQVIKVRADLAGKPAYLKCAVKVEAGSAGSKVLRLGVPDGNDETGYVLYEGDLSSYPQGPVQSCDPAWAPGTGASADLDYLFDHHVHETLISDDYEQYSAGQELGEAQGWTAGYGTLGDSGTVTVRSGHGGRYVEIAYKNGLFGAHRNFERAMRPGWRQGHRKGYFRVSFDARFTGSANKYLGFWNPQMVEGNFQSTDKGYRFRSNASDTAEEFVSQNVISRDAWSRISMIVEAVPVRTGDNWRHILRQLKVDGQVENCYAPLDQSSDADYFNTLRFFLWGGGSLCIDNLKVETIVSETDYEVLDFPEEDPMQLVVSGASGAACGCAFPAAKAAGLDFEVRYGLTFSNGTYKVLLDQDGSHRHFATELSLGPDGQVKPAFPDCAGAAELDDFSGVVPGRTFTYGYSIGTSDRTLQRLNWNGRSIDARLPLQTSGPADISSLVVKPTGGVASLSYLRIALAPRVAVLPEVSYDYAPFALGKSQAVIMLTNTVDKTEVNFSLSLEDGRYFAVSPSKGTFERSRKIVVTTKNTRDKLGYFSDILTMDFGEAGRGQLRLGLPSGNSQQGYVLYSADFTSFPEADALVLDHALAGGPDVSATTGPETGLAYVRTTKSPAGEGGLFVKVDSPARSADFDLCLAATLQVPEKLVGSLVISQDAAHRQLQGTITQKDGRFVLQFPDCKEASELVRSGPAPDAPFRYGYTISTVPVDKQFRDFSWGTQEQEVFLPITGKEVQSAETVESIRFYLFQKGQEMRIRDLEVSMVPAVPEPAFLGLLGLLLALLASGRRNG